MRKTLGATALVATFFLCWAVYNVAYKHLPDLGVVTFTLVVAAALFGVYLTYADTTKTVKYLPVSCKTLTSLPIQLGSNNKYYKIYVYYIYIYIYGRKVEEKRFLMWVSLCSYFGKLRSLAQCFWRHTMLWHTWCSLTLSSNECISGWPPSLGWCRHTTFGKSWRSFRRA